MIFQGVGEPFHFVDASLLANQDAPLAPSVWGAVADSYGRRY